MRWLERYHIVQLKVLPSGEVVTLVTGFCKNQSQVQDRQVDMGAQRKSAGQVVVALSNRVFAAGHIPSYLVELEEGSLASEEDSAGVVCAVGALGHLEGKAAVEAQCSSVHSWGQSRNVHWGSVQVE